MTDDEHSYYWHRWIYWLAFSKCIEGMIYDLEPYKENINKDLILPTTRWK